MGAIPSYSVISLRRLGGASDLRVPCVFGQRLNGYHPAEGSIVVFNFALAPVFAEPRIGTMEKLGGLYGKLDGTATTAPRVGKNSASNQRVGKSAAACPKT
jgi:hypothetical protein